MKACSSTSTLAAPSSRAVPRAVRCAASPTLCEDFDAITARINELIDESGAEIATARWLPGSDWTGTAFEPIYTKAARGDSTARRVLRAARLVHDHEAPERWGSGKYEPHGEQIRSRTYFRLK